MSKPVPDAVSEIGQDSPSLQAVRTYPISIQCLVWKYFRTPSCDAFVRRRCDQPPTEKEYKSPRTTTSGPTAACWLGLEIPKEGQSPNPVHMFRCCCRRRRHRCYCCSASGHGRRREDASLRKDFRCGVGTEVFPAEERAEEQARIVTSSARKEPTTPTQPPLAGSSMQPFAAVSNKRVMGVWGGRRGEGGKQRGGEPG